MLTLIRTVHTAVWLAEAGAILFTFWSGLTGRGTRLVRVPIAMVVVEGAVLLAGGWRCPLNRLARDLTSDPLANDTFLPPAVFFRGYKVAWSAVFVAGLMLLMLRHPEPPVLRRTDRRG